MYRIIIMLSVFSRVNGFVKGIGVRGIGGGIGGGGVREVGRLFSKKSRSRSMADVVGSVGGRSGDGCGSDVGLSLTKNQQLYVDALNDPEVALVVVMGSAGTGKTFIGCQWGMQRFLDGDIGKMVITRPLVPVAGEQIGFIPGGVVSKMEPWTRPIYDAFLEKDLINKKMLDRYICEGNIEINPLAFMRGRTFSNSFIFADEMQNSTPEQMLMLLTRIGNKSKIVISGDLAQSDILRGGNVSNGLYDFTSKLKKWNMSQVGYLDKSIRIIEFDKMDVSRSKITSTVLDIYNDNHKDVDFYDKYDVNMM